MTKEKTTTMFVTYGALWECGSRKIQTLVQQEWSTWIPCWLNKVSEVAGAHLPGKGEILCFFVFKEI